MFGFKKKDEAKHPQMNSNIVREYFDKHPGAEQMFNELVRSVENLTRRVSDLERR